MIINGTEIQPWMKAIVAFISVLVSLTILGAFLMAPVTNDVNYIKEKAQKNQIEIEGLEHQFHSLEREMIDRLGRIETKIDNQNQYIKGNTP